MKKALSLLITAAMLVAMLAVMAPAAFAAEAVQVGTADELIDVVTKINAGELAADTNITLTADIDLTGKAWKPLKVYSGTFDGAGYTIKNLTQTVKVENNGENKLNQGGGTNNAVYVMADYESVSGNGRNCFGEAGFALLAVKGEGATFKNFTLKDSSLNVTWSFNKNWQPFYGGVVACLNGGSISDVKLENVDIPVDEPAAENQGYLGFAGLMVGATSGEVTIENCSVDADSTLDASANKKFDVAAIVGRHSSESPLTVVGCTTAATVKAAPDVSNKDGLMYTAEDSMLGGWAAAFVARFNDNTAEGVYDVILDCSNTGVIEGAHKNGGTKIFVGDLNTRARVRYQYTAPGGLVGSVVEPQAKIWVTEGEKFYAYTNGLPHPDRIGDGIFLADKKLDEGKIELKLHRRVERTSQCSGIIFCVTDAEDDCNFWSGGDCIAYFLFVDEGGALRFAIDGGYREEGVYTGQTGWYEFVGAGDQVNLINAGYDVVAGVTLGVEFDNDGNVQVYVNGDLIYDVDIPEDKRLPGTGFGFRMISESDNSTYTSSITAKAKCYHEETEVVGAKDATETEDGYTGDTVCKDCGEVLRKGESIPAKEPATEEKPPKTGDVVLTVSVLALAAATGTVLIARKRKIEE